MTQYLTKQEVAAKLVITTRGLDRMMKERRIPFVKVGKLVRFNEVHLENWIKAKTTTQKTA